MENFNELSPIKQWGVLLAGAVLLTAALYYGLFRGQQAENDTAQQALEAKLRENAELESYRPKLAEIERQLASLKQQLEIEQRIVPDQKSVDDFMHMLNAEALKSNIEIRRYSAQPVAAKEFYTEVPFEIELDGTYYNMLTFFDRVSKLERIVNISDLLMSTTKKPSDAKTKHQYQYSPNESVVATCVATTFYTKDLEPSAAAAHPKAAAPAQRGAL